MSTNVVTCLGFKRRCDRLVPPGTLCSECQQAKERASDAWAEVTGRPPAPSQAERVSILDILQQRIDWHRVRGKEIRELPLTPEERAQAIIEWNSQRRCSCPELAPPQTDYFRFMGVGLVEHPATPACGDCGREMKPLGKLGFCCKRCGTEFYR